MTTGLLPCPLVNLTGHCLLSQAGKVQRCHRNFEDTLTSDSGSAEYTLYKTFSLLGIWLVKLHIRKQEGLFKDNFYCFRSVYPCACT